MDALLVVDMQEGFRCEESESILTNLLSLRDVFDGKIIFSKFVNDTDSLFERQLGWSGLQEGIEQQLFCELASEKNTEITHNSYTILNDTLRAFMHSNAIKRVYLAGVYTDVCIIKAAMDLFDAGIAVFVIEDACASPHGKTSHDSAIDSLTHILSNEHIISTKDLCL